jgi:hypothetical protein
MFRTKPASENLFQMVKNRFGRFTLGQSGDSGIIGMRKGVRCRPVRRRSNPIGEG